MATKKEKTPATPDQIARRKAQRVIAFATWRRDWREKNPDASREDRSKAWAEVRKAEVRKARKTLKALENGGFKVELAEA